MKSRLEILASLSLIALQSNPSFMQPANAQDQTVTITGSRPPAPCPVNATCYTGIDGYSSGGTGGGNSYIPESEAAKSPAPAPSPQKQAEQIANGIVMPCPKANENFNPGYFQRAMKDCQGQVATALGKLSNDTIT